MRFIPNAELLPSVHLLPVNMRYHVDVSDAFHSANELIFTLVLSLINVELSLSELITSELSNLVVKLWQFDIFSKAPLKVSVEHRGSIDVTVHLF